MKNKIFTLSVIAILSIFSGCADTSQGGDVAKVPAAAVWGEKAAADLEPVFMDEEITDYAMLTTEQMSYQYGIFTPESAENRDKGAFLAMVLRDSELDNKDDYVTSKKDGVTLKIWANPMTIGTIAGTVDEINLHGFLEMSYSELFHENFRNLQIGEKKEIDENHYTCRVSGVNLEQNASAFDDTILLIRYDENLTLVLQVIVCYDEVNENTYEILRELEDFYGMEIAFDSESAKQLKEEYLATLGQENERIYFDELHLLFFELPHGWKLVEASEDKTYQMYAPDGNPGVSGCAISVVSFPASDIDDPDALFESEEFILQLKSQLPAEWDDFMVTKCEDTFLGNTHLVMNTVGAGENKSYFKSYYGIYHQSGYLVEVMYTTDGKESAETGEEILFESGRSAFKRY